MLYFVVEVSRTDDSFGDELSECWEAMSRSTLAVLKLEVPYVQLTIYSGHVSLPPARSVSNDSFSQGSSTKRIPGEEGIAVVVEDVVGLFRWSQGGGESQDAVEGISRSAASREK